MNWVDLIIVFLVAVVVFLIVFFNVKSYKKDKCIGCPYSKECKKNNSLDSKQKNPEQKQKPEQKNPEQKPEQKQKPKQKK